ncbi:hypothetical protein [Nocardia mexicana]|uniref:hypothetical protein n=1 Tax=Nocardia mexicana TaxID=279262 RepID=UPI0011C079DD|nr:hypothetical protein [Nocardia mexicana]
MTQLEARVAALEAERVDGRAVLAAVHAHRAKTDADQERNESKFAALQAGQEALQARQDVLQSGQEALQAGQEALQARQDVLQSGQEALQAGQEALQAGQGVLETRADFQREATNALGLRLAEFQQETRDRFDRTDRSLAALRSGQRALEENFAEFRDLLVQALDRGRGE